MQPTLTLNDFARAAGTRGYGTMYAKLDSHGKVKGLGTLNTSKIAHALPLLFDSQASQAENRAARVALYDAIINSGYVAGNSQFLDSIRSRLGIDSQTGESNHPLERRKVQTIISEVKAEAAKSLSLLIDHGFTADDIAMMKHWVSSEAQEEYVKLFNDAKGDEAATAALVAAMRFTLESCRTEQTGVASFFAAQSYDPSSPDGPEREKCQAAAETLKKWIADRMPACNGADGTDCRTLLGATVERHLLQASKTIVLCKSAAEEHAALETFVRSCIEETEGLVAKMRTARAELIRIAGDEVAEFDADAQTSSKVTNGTHDVNVYLRFTLARVARALSRDRDLGKDGGDTAIAKIEEDFKVGVRSLLSADDERIDFSDGERMKARATAYLSTKFEAVESKLDGFGIFVDHKSVLSALTAKGLEIVTNAHAEEADKESFSLGDYLAWCGNEFDLAFDDLVSALGKVKTDMKPETCVEFKGFIKELGDSLDDVINDQIEHAIGDAFANRFGKNLNGYLGHIGDLTMAKAEKLTSDTVKEVRALVKQSAKLASQTDSRLSKLPAVVKFIKAPDPERQTEIREEDRITDDMRSALYSYIIDLSNLRRVDILQNPDSSERHPSDDELDAMVGKKIDELVAGRRTNVQNRITEKFLEAKRDFDAKIPAVENELKTFAAGLKLDTKEIGFELLAELDVDGTSDEISNIYKYKIDLKSSYYRDVPPDFTEDMAEDVKFDAQQFVSEAKKTLREHWTAGAKLYGEALRDLESFFRASELPEGLTFKSSGFGVPCECESLRKSVMKSMADVRRFAFSGNPNAAKAVVAKIRESVTNAIAAHNASLYGSGELGKASNQLTAITAINKLVKGKDSLQDEMDRATVQVIGEAYIAGYQNLADEIRSDSVKWHRDGEVQQVMDARIREVIGVRKRCREYIANVLLERADLDLVLDRNVTNENGEFKIDYSKVFTEEVDRRFKLLILNCQKVLIANPTAYDSEEKFKHFVDPFATEIINEALQEKNKANLADLIRRFDDVKGDVIAAAFEKLNGRLSSLSAAIPVELLYRRISKWAEEKIATLRRPLPNKPGDTRMHANTYRTFTTKELIRELTADVDARLSAFAKVEAQLRQSVQSHLKERHIHKVLAKNAGGILNRVNAAIDSKIKAILEKFENLAPAEFAATEEDVTGLLNIVDKLTMDIEPEAEKKGFWPWN